MSNAEGEEAGTSVKLQDPEETIKPEVNIQQIPDLIWSLYGLKVVSKMQQNHVNHGAVWVVYAYLSY